jgi:hypothetical protein
MLANNERSTNLFERLFSYAPRSKRNPLEDYCTEALAWLLIKSPKFSAAFLDLIREELGRGVKNQLAGYRGDLDISTQVSYTGNDEAEGDDENSGSGRFDLVLKPKGSEGFIVVLESKVGLDPNVGLQAAEYKERLRTHPHFRKVIEGERYVITLTPASGTPSGADGHLSWARVHDLLREFRPEAKPIRDWFLHFAEFLKNHYIAVMSLPILDLASIQKLQDFGHFLKAAKEQFGAFVTDEVLKQFFHKRDAERASVDADKNGFWYGIWSDKSGRFAAAYLVFRGKEIALYVQVDYAGRRLKAKGILKAAEAAAKDFLKGDNYERSGGSNSSYFVRRNAQSGTDHRQWFRDVFCEISKQLGD